MLSIFTQINTVQGKFNIYNKVEKCPLYLPSELQ